MKGGTHKIIDGLVEGLASNISTNTPIEAIRQTSDGRYELHSGGSVYIKDYLIMANPASALRNMELSGLNLDEGNRQWIRDLTMATNGKILVATHEQPIDPHQDTTKISRALNGFAWQAGERNESSRAVVVYLGGKDGASVSQAMVEQCQDRLRSGVEEAFPGTRTTGEVIPANWAQNPYIGGSYTAFGLNQGELLEGIRPLNGGTVQWAGEHAGGEFVCYMEGAVRSGEEASSAILKKPKK